MASVTRTTSRRRPWQVRWRDPSGAQRKRSFARRVDADRFRAQVERELDVGTYVDPSARRVTFREYAERWRQIQPHRPNTATRVRSELHRHVYPVLGDVPLVALRPTDVQSFAAGLRLSPGSVRPVMATVRAVLGAAVRDQLIPRDPSERVKLPELPREEVTPLTVDQVWSLADAVPERYGALVVVGAGAGLRQGELFGLQPRDVDFLRKLLRVERQLQPHGVAPLKNRASYRTIPVAQVVVDALAAHLRDFPADRDGFVFTDDEGRPLERRWFNERVWKPAVEKVGLQGVGSHALRHFYASLLIRAGLSVKVVAARLGHASPTITLNTYSHLWPDDADRSRQAVQDVLAPGADVPVARPVWGGDLR